MRRWRFLGVVMAVSLLSSPVLAQTQQQLQQQQQRQQQQEQQQQQVQTQQEQEAQPQQQQQGSPEQGPPPEQGQGGPAAPGPEQPGPDQGGQPAGQQNGGFQPQPISISGYLAPGFGFKYRPTAVDRDRFEPGFDGGAGLIFSAAPIQYFRATIHMTLSAHALTTVLVDAQPVDNNGDGIIEGYTFSRADNVPGVGFEEADIAFNPINWFTLKAGILRIPLTSAQQSPATATLFPFRPEPNDVFLTGADFGGLAIGEFADGRFITSVGAFNGTSLGMLLRTERFDQRGMVVSYRADVNPFGRFSMNETDPNQKEFRLGLGFGALYRPSAIYDKGSGYEVTKANDVRWSGSLRMAYQGLTVAAEYMRRVQTDNLTSRPQVADGAYAQIGWYLHLLKPFAFEPIARAGYTVLNAAVEPQLVEWLDLGVSLYPFAGGDRPDVFKLWLEYNGERRLTEGETAHGALINAQLQF